MTEPATFFATRAALYDSLIDWAKRLATEAPFYRRLFEQFEVRRVLDAACGTGRHAAMFHGWGLEVEGADLSPDMIAEARRTFGEPAGLRWVERSFEMPPSACSFDAVICVGNSLALAGSPEAIQRSIRGLLASVRPGGLCVIHVLNLWRLREGPVLWQKHVRARLEGREHILLKGVHRCGSRGFVQIADLDITETALVPEFVQAEFPGLEAKDLQSWVTQAGGEVAQLSGSYKEDMYIREESQDIILVARRIQ